VDPNLAAEAIAQLKPQPVKTITQDSTFEPWNQGLQVGYIFAEHDKAIAIEVCDPNGHQGTKLFI
jgi:hypothetical protein